MGFGSKDALVEVTLKDEKGKDIKENKDSIEETCCKDEVFVKSDDLKKN